MGLAGNETSPPGLGEAVACREQEARPRRTTMDRPRWVVPENTSLTKRMKKLPKGLWKAESALLTQARTRRIQLAKFLYGRSVPGFTTATCQYRPGQEIPRHMALYCTYKADRRY